MLHYPVSKTCPIRVIFVGAFLASILINQFVFSSPLSMANSLTSYSADTSKATVNQPIIFVHGITQNANDMGHSAFVPLYQELERLYGKIDTFQYVDDLAYRNSCPPYPSCTSQSAVLDNAVRLAQWITDLYKSRHHKVALIGYSMGAAIIRTALAGCQQGIHCQSELGPKIGEMVNNVFFINGVQQGSWLLQDTKEKNTLNPVINILTNPAFREPIYQLAKDHLHLDAHMPAEKDLKPESLNIISHNSVVPPSNIHYFNFYGDIHLNLQGNMILGWPSFPPIDLNVGGRSIACLGTAVVSTPASARNLRRSKRLLVASSASDTTFTSFMRSLSGILLPLCSICCNVPLLIPVRRPNSPRDHPRAVRYICTVFPNGI